MAHNHPYGKCDATGNVTICNADGSVMSAAEIQALAVAAETESKAFNALSEDEQGDWLMSQIMGAAGSDMTGEFEEVFATLLGVKKP